MSMTIWITLCLVLVCGCARPAHEVRIVPTGHGTFMIPAQDLLGASSGATAKARAYQEASVFCAKRGAEIETVPASASEGGFTQLAAPEIEFRCLTAAAK